MFLNKWITGQSSNLSTVGETYKETLNGLEETNLSSKFNELLETSKQMVFNLILLFGD